MTDVARQTASDKTAVRPFHVSIPEAELAEMRKRINSTRWPEREWEQPKLFSEELRAGFRSLRAWRSRG